MLRLALLICLAAVGLSYAENHGMVAKGSILPALPRLSPSLLGSMGSLASQTLAEHVNLSHLTPTTQESPTPHESFTAEVVARAHPG